MFVYKSFLLALHERLQTLTVDGFHFTGVPSRATDAGRHERSLA